MPQPLPPLPLHARRAESFQTTRHVLPDGVALEVVKLSAAEVRPVSMHAQATEEQRAHCRPRT
jgi:hypothetical protein